MTKYYLSLVCAIVLIAGACKKSEPDPIQFNSGGGNNGGSLTRDKVFQDLEQKPQSFTLDAASGGTIKGLKGTTVKFFPNSFVTQSGASVTGNVDIKLEEFVSRGDMIFSKMLPISNGQALNSGGEYILKITQNGNPVRMAPFMQFEVKLPQNGRDELNGMQVFYGEEIPGETNNVNWVVADTMKQDSGKGGPVVIRGNDTLHIWDDSIGMCNADAFMSNPNYVSFTIQLTGATGLSSANTSAYALYADYYAVWPMLTINNNVITENHIPDIPMHFVVFSIINGKFYGGTLSVTPTQGGSYTLNVTEVDPEDFKDIVDNL